VKLIALKIDGYGIWSGLRVERFSDGLNVLYGPNEAGKTTLLHFIRSMLYGFSESRRQYFPPVHGGQPGGMAEVDSVHGRYEIARHLNPENGSEAVVLTASDGTRQGEHLVKAMLSDVDEAIFNNVFAVELREMQELAVLGDTAAAELLYNLTAGLDRVSLVEVLRELEISRNRILDGEGKPCLIQNLRGRREKLCEEIGELGGLTRRFGLLVGERSQLERDIARLEEERNQLERQTRILDLAVSLSDRWSARLLIDAELAAIGPIAPLPDKMIERLDALNAKLERHRRRIAELRHQRGELRGEATGIALNEDLLRQYARVEALQEQESWFAGVNNQIGELEAKIARLEKENADLWRQLGFDAEPAIVGNLTPRSFVSLRSPAKNLHHARESLEQARIDAKTAQETADSLAQEIAGALSTRNASNLNEAMDQAGQMVSQYRRRLQIDERLDQLSRHAGELDEQNRRAVERQLLPAWVFAVLGTLFILSVLLVLTGSVILPIFSSGANWLIAVLGVVGIASTVFGKISLEKSNAAKLDAVQKQLALAQGQIKQIKEERDEMDGRLPRGGGPLVSRLDAAENELSELEALVPLESRRGAAVQSAASARERAERAEEDYKAARRKWRDSLASLGLSVELSSAQVRQLAGRWNAMSENLRRLTQCRDDLDRRRKEAESLAARLSQVAGDANVPLPDTGVLEQLKYLGNALAEQQAVAARRDAVRNQLKQLRHLRARHEEAIGRLNHRRRNLFFEAGAEDEDSFRQKALQSARGEALRSDRDSLARDIAATIGKECSEEAIRELLEKMPPGELESRGNLLRERLAMLGAQVGERLEKRGQLNAQIQSLADDRQLPRLQLDLAAIDRQIADATKRWQVLAVVCRLLEDIRASYERERQPETLKEASHYLTRLTQGRYSRVWTPLGEKTLRVDDAEGHSLPVESLSRGTREQLFLSLRLALAAGYARRGAELPMVLDDVLVNFDADRAIAAAEVLRDFAALGHQLLVCTCHEHIEKIFAQLDVPLNRLPRSANREGAVIAFTRKTIVEEPKREREKPRSSPRKKPPVKPKIAEEVLPSVEEEVFDEEPPKPITRASKPSPQAAKKAARNSGVFDVDFFDATDDSEEEMEAVEENDVIWEEEFEEKDGFDDEENGEMI
jgi:uncharacterized protein YhaN